MKTIKSHGSLLLCTSLIVMMSACSSGSSSSDSDASELDASELDASDDVIASPDETPDEPLVVDDGAVFVGGGQRSGACI